MNKKLLRQLGLNTEFIIQSKGLELKGSEMTVLFNNIDIISVEELIGYVIDLCKRQNCVWSLGVTKSKNIGDNKISGLKITLTTKKFIWIFKTSFDYSGKTINAVRNVKEGNQIISTSMLGVSFKIIQVTNSLVEYTSWSLVSSDFE